MLYVRAQARLGSFSLDVELAAVEPEVLALVGESGSGKTTLLRVVAGLLEPDSGRIALGGRVLFDGDAGVRLPPRLRPVGYVAQDYALFPHLSVRRNVAFGLRASGMHGRALAERVDAQLERFGLRELAERRPGELSGGQQQRVALARALALEPELLLLDEPLAALDLATRRRMRRELVRALEGLGGAAIVVTHSPSEALALGKRIAVLEEGRITQFGTREELLLRPRTRYVAEFLGTNWFRGLLRRSEEGLVHLATDGGEIVASAEPGLDGEVFAVVDPRDITLALVAPSGSAQNVLAGTVEDLQPEPPDGERVRVSLGTRPPLVVEVTRAASQTLGLVLGTPVHASFKATGVRLFI